MEKCPGGGTFGYFDYHLADGSRSALLAGSLKITGSPGSALLSGSLQAAQNSVSNGFRGAGKDGLKVDKTLHLESGSSPVTLQPDHDPQREDERWRIRVWLGLPRFARQVGRRDDCTQLGADRTSVDFSCTVMKAARRVEETEICLGFPVRLSNCPSQECVPEVGADNGGAWGEFRIVVQANAGERQRLIGNKNYGCHVLKMA